MEEEAATSPPLREAENAPAAPPPPPSAAKEHSEASQEATDDVLLSNGVISDENNDVEGERRSAASRSAHLHLPASAAKASSAARSMAATARSKLAQGGRRVLSPLAHAASGVSSKASKKEKASPSSADSVDADAEASSSEAGMDPLASVTSAAGSLTSGLTSSLASASSSLGSLLFSSQTSTTSSIDVADMSPGDSRVAEEAAAAIAEAEAEAAAAAEVLRQVTAQQRMRILEDLVQHRRSDWNYLKAMHEGSNYWLNVALLREQQVMQHLGEKQSIRRGAQFFYLGIGLGRLIGESTHPELLAMDCCQLLEELEFYFSSSTVQGMPFPLDYREVLLSLCDILALIYSKLVEDNSSSENLNLFQAIIRFDERIKVRVWPAFFIVAGLKGF
ncbi:hypothetical protein BBJ28_00006271 [Nothophytophthora sp. Chile5]|nr:hypothetical protein BBJ28_00006271 [Nothophytophthora sp. Chile5]